MQNEQKNWQSVEEMLEEMAQMHRKALLALGRRIVPTLTPEDMLQPNDYPELEHHPEFRYEEGVLAGIQSAQIAVRVMKKDL
jgi:hypothetical protein